MEKHHTGDEGGEHHEAYEDRALDPIIDVAPAATESTPATTAETEPDYPRIYLADVAAAEAGIQHGLWVNAARETAELEDEVHRLLATSQFRGTTTYTISGAEGFQGYVISEHEDLAVVSRAALGIAEYGRAFVAYLEWMGASQEAVEQFEDSYHGSWPNLAAWAEATVNGFGWWQAIEQAVPANLLPYVVIDYWWLGQDMARGMHVIEDDEHHEVHLFRPAE